MAYLTDLCEAEGPLYHWRREAAREEIEADPERAAAARDLSASYWLYDVDKDGIPELFMEYGDFYLPRIECCTYRDGVVTTIGDLGGQAKGSNFFSWPGKNAILDYWAWKGAFILWEYSIVDGELVCVDEDGIASQFGGPGEPDPKEHVPGAVYLEPSRVRTLLSEDTPMLLPICHYSGWTVARAGKEERAAARRAIEGALYRQEPFFGTSVSDYTGATGWVLFDTYCRKTAYSDALTPVERVWMDLDGDGAEECVVRFRYREQESSLAVFHYQDGTVYAYYLYCGPKSLSTDGVFFEESPYYLSSAYGQVLHFHQNQCYWECIPYPENPVPVEWESFS